MSNLSRKEWENLVKRLLQEDIDNNRTQITMDFIEKVMQKMTQNQIMDLSSKIMYRSLKTNQELMNYMENLMENPNQKK